MFQNYDIVGPMYNIAGIVAAMVATVHKYELFFEKKKNTTQQKHATIIVKTLCRKTADVIRW